MIWQSALLRIAAPPLCCISSLPRVGRWLFLIRNKTNEAGLSIHPARGRWLLPRLGRLKAFDPPVQSDLGSVQHFMVNAKCHGVRQHHLHETKV